MKSYFFVILIIVFSAIKCYSQTTATMFSQCGGLYASGKQFDGPNDCGLFGNCVTINYNYYECIPKSISSNNTNINKTCKRF